MGFLSKISIGKKITLGFSSGLILIACMAIVSSLYLKHAKSSVVDATKTTHDHAFMLKKEIDHLNWMSELSALFWDEHVNSVTVQTDDHKCGLGKWLYSEQSAALAQRDPQYAELIEKIKEPHARLHESAKKIAATYHAFDPELNILLASRWIDHLNWIKNLNNSILTGSQFEGGLDPSQCAFGKWYHSYTPKNQAFATLLVKWEEPHRQLHASASAIVQAQTKKNSSQAATIYRQKTLPLLAELEDAYLESQKWITTNSQRNKTAHTVFNTDTKNALQDTQSILQSLVTITGTDAEHVSASVLTEINSTVFLIIGVSFLAIALGSLSAFLIIRAISRPLNKAITGLEQGSTEVDLASKHIATSSHTLADSAQQLAATNEQVSSSMEEITSMARQNAENSKIADAHMQEANDILQTASLHMNELTTSMSEISASSQETSKIVKTIDDIAFQTNLLALNAAVEAARAGEAGAGFAVVAEEVRNLAMRAATAAHETSTLLEATVTNVQGGTSKLKDTTTAFANLHKKVSGVVTLLAEITVASNEQAHGVSQANKGVTEMEAVAQRIAATAEESSAASEELSAQSELTQDYVHEMANMIHGAKTHGGTHSNPTGNTALRLLPSEA